MPRSESPRPSWFGRGRTRALLSLGLLVGMGAVATSAYWTAEGDVVTGPVSSGALHLDLATNYRVKSASPPHETHAWVGLSLADIAPGASRAAVLPVTNNSQGPVTFSYRVQASAPGVLGAELSVVVRRGAALNGTTCTGGSLVGSGALDGFDQPAGADLAPTQSHNICVQVTRSAAALPNGATSAVAFTFPATQVPS